MLRITSAAGFGSPFRDSSQNYFGLGGSGLSSDSFDLRAVMATTNWDGSSTTLGNYLTQGTAGTDLQLSLHPTGGSSASVFATLTGVGQQAGAFANFEQHAIF